MQYFYGMLWLLTVHFIADFVLQSDWMAQNKSKSNKALSIHVGIYTAALLIGAIPLSMLLWDAWAHHLLHPNVVVWVALNGAAHFVTDYITSRINASLWAAKQVHNFFVGVGADQLIHSLTLGLTMVWLLQ